MTTLDDITKAQADYDHAVAQVPICLAALNLARANYVPPVKATVFAIIDEVGLMPNELSTMVQGAQEYISEVAFDYKKGQVHIVVGKTDGAIPCYITHRKAIPGDAAYHTVENGLPVVYVQPGTAYNRFGYYHPALLDNHTKTVLQAEIITMGPFGALLHELAETLIDPMGDLYSAPDSKGRQWKMEIGDHVQGSDWMEPINGFHCVFPNYTLPNEYVLGSEGPWDKKGVLHGPMSMTLKGYGKDKTGAAITFATL